MCAALSWKLLGCTLVPVSYLEACPRDTLSSSRDSSTQEHRSHLCDEGCLGTGVFPGAELRVFVPATTTAGAFLRKSEALDGT